MITFWGVLILLVFLLCYLGQSISSGMKGQNAKRLQWLCWLLACGTMLLCYLFTEAQGG